MRSDAAREHGQPGDEHPPTAQEVTEPGPEQQQAAEHQGVGVLHPGQAGGAQVQAGRDASAGR